MYIVGSGGGASAARPDLVLWSAVARAPEIGSMNRLLRREGFGQIPGSVMLYIVY